MNNSKSSQNKKYLSKNKSIKLYKDKKKKRDAHAKAREILKEQYDKFDVSTVANFSQFPVTLQTKLGLKKQGYTVPTEIQKETIGHALKGSDVIAAAKTGSGKTLAFVVPILERLFQEGWSKTFGLGALIITPTRELALQIFEVFSSVGKLHDFTVGLVIGGQGLRLERKILNLYNIVICTPGRLLQHMDQNPLFDSTNLQILVLDEADRILDAGFQELMNAILENLPQEKQTLLFSATQTTSVQDLARLNLSNPIYISVHAHAKHATPETLKQNYVVLELSRKLDFLWSFIKHHKRQKILIFMATCKQVKYTYEIFCKMKPGVSLLALYGGLHQSKRIERYKSFCRKIHVVMFATDLAARGLDFPDVNWVVQLDCPEDVSTYIHRAGRTARYEKGGQSLLCLLPSEKESMIKQMENRKIPINEIKVHPRKIMSVQRKIQALCVHYTELQESARRAFMSYYKNIFLMKDKSIFDIASLNVTDIKEAFAQSLGLINAPRIRFIEKRLKQTGNLKSCDLEDAGKDVSEWKSSDISGDESDNDDAFMTVKKNNTSLDDKEDLSIVDDVDQEASKKHKIITKAALAKRILKKKIKPNIKITYNEDGEVINEVLTKPKSAEEFKEALSQQEHDFIEIRKQMMNKEDEIDKVLYREKIKDRRREKKQKLKEKMKEEIETIELGPQLSNEEAEEEVSQKESVSGDMTFTPQITTELNNISDNDELEEPAETSTMWNGSEINRKRKKGSSKKKRKKLKIMDDSCVDVNTAVEDEPLEYAENLALQLLMS